MGPDLDLETPTQEPAEPNSELTSSTSWESMICTSCE